MLDMQVLVSWKLFKLHEIMYQSTIISGHTDLILLPAGKIFLFFSD